MHQYDLVPLPPNFHLSSYYEPTNSKSKCPCYLLLCTVGASSTGYGPWCQRWWCLSSALIAVVKTSLSCNQYAFCTLLSAMQLPSTFCTSDTASCMYHSVMLLTSAPHSLVMQLKDCSETTVLFSTPALKELGKGQLWFIILIVKMRCTCADKMFCLVPLDHHQTSCPQHMNHPSFPPPCPS